MSRDRLLARLFSYGKADGMDDLGRSSTIVQLGATRCEEILLFSRVDNRVGMIALTAY